MISHSHSISRTMSRLMLQGLVALTAAFGILSHANADEAYPTRTITLVVAFPPGGPPDVVARIIGPAIAKTLGKSVVVENRPGASATIAGASVARAEPDGHTLLSADLSFVVSPYVVPTITYDPMKDFKPVVLMARTGLTMVIDPKTGIASPQDLVAAARKDPSSIKAAHTGIGTPPHLGLMSFLRATGIEVLQVPYKGAAMAIQDIVAGHITLLCTGPSTSVELTKAGKVRMLGVTGSKRLAELPDVPTFGESGVDMGGMKDGQYFGIAAPAATPDAVVAKINAAVNKALQDPQIRAQLEKVAFEAVGGSAAEFTSMLQAQSAYWKGAMAGVAVSSTK